MKYLLFLALIFFSTYTLAQSEAANWYFGYGGGISFNQINNTVSSVNNGQLFTNEGCTSISDSSGNLLFYTDGTNVWNKNHTIMLNGSGLYGDSSSTQSAIIVPKPNDPKIYYVFTVDNWLDDVNFGLNYSEIDISLDGGLGAVTNKNINLLQQSSEKITAVLKDCITKSIWVLTFASENGTLDVFNTFHAFEVSTTGVNTNSVTSTLDIDILDARGYLKLSPDGTKMASANVRNGLFLYDFDVSTGIISNQQSIRIEEPNDKPYGLEFSPNSQLLYVNSSNDFFGEGSNNPSSHSSTLTQFNLLSSDIEGSAYILDNRQLYRGGLQLAPNGKIYRALSSTYNQGLTYLGVVNNPNNIGNASAYQHNAINLSPNYSTQGLPPFIQSFFNAKIDIIKNGKSSTNLSLCEGDSYTLETKLLPGARYQWSLDKNLLSNSDFYLEVTQSGHYEVYIDPNNGDCAIEGQAFVVFNENPEAYNGNLAQCDEDGTIDGKTLFNLNEANYILTGGVPFLSTRFYKDSNRSDEIVDGNSFYNTSNPQTIYVQVVNDQTECSNISELTLNVSSTDSNNSELIVCDDDGTEDGYHIFNLTEANNTIVNNLPLGLDISYYKTYENALLEEDNLGSSFTNNIAYSQIIYARVENANNCYGISEVLLTVIELPQIETEDLTYYCLNTFPQSIRLNAGLSNDSPSNYSYLWSTSENTYDIEINQPGTYSVTVFNSNNCSKERRIIVEPSNIATFQSIDIVDASKNNMITVLVSGEGLYEYQLLNDDNEVYRPYQEDNVFDNVFPGFYQVVVRDVKNDCGIVNDLVSVIGFPKFFTPNNDGFHDTWQVYGISSMFQSNSKIYIYDRYGKLLKQLNPLGKGWDGIFNGKKLPSDDYWFSVKLQDGRVFKNHFTLKQ